MLLMYGSFLYNKSYRDMFFVLPKRPMYSMLTFKRHQDFLILPKYAKKMIMK